MIWFWMFLFTTLFMLIVIACLADWGQRIYTDLLLQREIAASWHDAALYWQARAEVEAMNASLLPVSEQQEGPHWM